MRSPIDAPILATACVIGLGLFAQSVSTDAPYQGPLIKLWNATFQAETVETPTQSALKHGKTDIDGYWL